MDEQGMVPFGAALQVNTVVLRTGLATVLGLVENGLAEEGVSVERLQTILTNIKLETIQALEDDKVASRFKPIGGMGGFDGAPGITWGDEVT